MATVALQTVGCKLNQAETEFLARKFFAAGYQIVAPEAPADIYLVNTCAVTHVADRKCRQLLRQTHRRTPNALIVVTGCYAQIAPEAISQMEVVDLLVGNGEKEQLVAMVRERVGGAVTPENSGFPLLRTRALVKIQDGCNEHCTFCIVPQARGQAQDVPLAQVLAEVESMVAEGYQEVILTGAQIGSYGNLEELVRRILEQTDVQRLRLSSLHPQDLTRTLVQLWQERRLCRHLHLPLQSGSDPVLRRMGRSYSTADFERAVALARGQIEDLAITTDVIVGFPGESNEEFERSYEFCERIGFAGLHVFPYSARPGTPAARMPNRVQASLKKERSLRMLELAERSARHFRQRFLGRTMIALWEREKAGAWVGLTDNYIRVFTRNAEPLANCLLPVKLVAEHPRGLWGQRI